MPTVRALVRACCTTLQRVSKLLRQLWVWLLVLALPVQALAAAQMLHCAAMHAPSTVQSPASAPAKSDDECPHHRAMANAAQDDSVSVGVDDSEEAASFGPMQCSVCAACFLGWAMPVGDWELADAQPPHAPPAARVAEVGRFLTEGLERPPRSQLA